MILSLVTIYKVENKSIKKLISVPFFLILSVAVFNIVGCLYEITPKAEEVRSVYNKINEESN